MVTPASISKEKVCECYPECMNCPLKYGSRNCGELEQNEINDIMYIVEVVERRSQTPFHNFGMSKEIMARLRAKLIWNRGAEDKDDGVKRKFYAKENKKWLNMLLAYRVML